MNHKGVLVSFCRANVISHCNVISHLVTLQKRRAAADDL